MAIRSHLKSKGAMPKNWQYEKNSKKEIKCCRNDKSILGAITIIGTVSVLLAGFLFFHLQIISLLPQIYISSFSIGYAIVYGICFVSMGIIAYLAYWSIRAYCDVEHDKFWLAVFCFLCIVVIFLIMLCVGNIEKAYYEAHFHNAAYADTLSQAYSNLDCRIIEKFQNPEHDNQPVWSKKNENYSEKMASKYLDYNVPKNIIHKIIIPEICK